MSQSTPAVYGYMKSRTIIKRIKIKKYRPSDMSFDNLFRLSTPDQRLLLKTLKSEQARSRLVSFLRVLNDATMSDHTK